MFQQVRKNLSRQERLPVDTLATRPLFMLASAAALLALPTYVRADTSAPFSTRPVLLGDASDSSPRYGYDDEKLYEIIQGLAVFEGDILLGEVNEDGEIPAKTNVRGLGRADSFARWPDGIVPYLSPTDNSITQQINIGLAIDHWMERSRITFVELDEDNADQYRNYLRFDNSNSCASYVGMQGGEQPIMVSDACTLGSVIHEIGHALGLFHEHTRSDRDNYVQINWSQIVKGKDINFKLQNIGTNDYGVYDYGSIMHYGEHFFSSSSIPTIVVPDGITIGQRTALSENDASSIDQMYATDLALLPPSDLETDEGVEYGITVLNQGNLGANEVQVIIKLADDTLWQGISSDGSWECKDYSPELRCTRSTLQEISESRFTVLAEPGSANVDDVRMRVTSRTLDTDQSNNAYNDDGSLSKEDISADARAMSNTGIQKPENQSGSTTANSLPDLGAAESVAANNDEPASAGALSGTLLLLLSLAGWRGIRTRRKQ